MRKYRSKYIALFVNEGQMEEHVIYAHDGNEAKREAYQFECDCADPTFDYDSGVPPFHFTGVIHRVCSVE